MQAFGRNGYGPRIGGCALLGEGELGPHLNNVARAETYLHAKFHLDPSYHLATIHQRPDRTDRQVGGFLRPDCAPSSERPHFRIPAVRNAPELRSQHNAAPPVQLQYPGKRLAAAAMPLPRITIGENSVSFVPIESKFFYNAQ